MYSSERWGQISEYYNHKQKTIHDWTHTATPKRKIGVNDIKENLIHHCILSIYE